MTTDDVVEVEDVAGSEEEVEDVGVEGELQAGTVASSITTPSTDPVVASPARRPPPTLAPGL
jgi:hypothetical protein